MKDFLDKIKRALNELEELIYHEPRINKHRKISDTEEVIEILENIFDVNNDPDEHLVNYFKSITKKNDYTVSTTKYLLFRSAIASLSKYTIPDIRDIMTQYYHTALTILRDTLINNSFKKNELITAFNKVKEDDYKYIFIKRDKENNDKCKNILSKSSVKMITKASEYCNYSFDDIFEIFSFEILRIMIEDEAI